MGNGKFAVVVGGSRGLGRGAVEALAGQGVKVVAIGRDQATLTKLASEVSGVATVAGDATDEALAQQVIGERPDLVVLCAGAAPVLRPIHELTWEELQPNWNVDAKMAFVWLRQALRLPMKPGSHVIVISSGAAVQGSPVSGGYASAKRAQWFMAQYAATEVERSGLGIRIHCLLPNLNPSTELGRQAIAAYARRAGVSDEDFARRFHPPLTPAIFGAAIVDLDTNGEKWSQLAYRVTGGGITPIA